MNDADDESGRQQNILLQLFAATINEAQLSVLAQVVAEMKAEAGKEDASKILSEIHRRTAAKANAVFAGAADLSPEAASFLAQALDQWKKGRQI